MGTKDTRAAHGASGKRDVLLFDPDHVLLVTDEKHPLYQSTVNDPFDEAMVLNIMHFGVLEPILVAKNTETGETECVAGRTRVKACREANKRLKKQGLKTHSIPALVKRGEVHMLVGTMVSENAIRREYSPMDRAREMQKLANMNRSDEEIAMTFGLKSAASVKTSLAVLDASRPVRDAVDAGTITMGSAAKLAKMEPEEQKKRLAQLQAHATPGKRNGGGKKRQAIVSGGPVQRGKREIIKAAEALKASGEKKAWLEALEWVLGEENALCGVTT